MGKTDKLIIAALASALVGALVGAGVIQYAQVLAYSGVNTQAAENVLFEKQVDYYRNVRSIQSELLQGTDAELPTPKQAAAPAQDANVHEAAPISDVPDYCAGTTHQRRTQCLLNTLEGIIFHLRENQ